MSHQPEKPAGPRRPDRPDVFASLASPTRREILHDLARRDTATASELAEELPVSRQAVVKHLTLLGEAGLVTSQRIGREVRYRVAPEPLADVASWLADLGAAWDQRLERLSRLLAARDPSSSELPVEPGTDPTPEVPRRTGEPPERPDEIPTAPRPDQAPIPDRPHEAPVPERPDEAPVPERPDEIPAPQRPDEIPLPGRPDEIPTPPRPDDMPVPERPVEIPTPRRPDEIPAPQRPIEIPPPQRHFPSTDPEVPGPQMPPEVPPLPR